jgi:hypothetical protein
MAHLPSGEESMSIRFGGRIGGDRRRARPPVVPAPRAEPQLVENPRRGGLSRRIEELNWILVRQAGDARRIADVIAKDEVVAPDPDPDPTPIRDPDPEPDPEPTPNIAAFAHAAAVLTLAIGAHGGASDAFEGEWFKLADFPDLDAIVAVRKEQFAARLEAALTRIVGKARTALMSGITPFHLSFIYDAAQIAHGGVRDSKGKPRR